MPYKIETDDSLIFFYSLSKINFWKSSFPGLLLQLLLPFAGVLREYGFAPGEASSKLQVQIPMLCTGWRPHPETLQ